MNSRKSVWSMLFAWMLPTMAAAQVPSHITIESGNGGSVIAPTNPNGFLNIGPYIWISDAKGIFSFQTNASNPTPLETGIYDFNLNSNWSIDNNMCLQFCSAGQIVKVNDTLAFCGGLGPQSGWQEWRDLDASDSQPPTLSEHVSVSV